MIEGLVLWKTTLLRFSIGYDRIKTGLTHFSVLKAEGRLLLKPHPSTRAINTLEGSNNGLWLNRSNLREINIDHAAPDRAVLWSWVWWLSRCDVTRRRQPLVPLELPARHGTQKQKNDVHKKWLAGRPSAWYSFHYAYNNVKGIRWERLDVCLVLNKYRSLVSYYNPVPTLIS